MAGIEAHGIKLREQAYNRLTLAAGNLILMGAGVYVTIEGRPFIGSAAAVGAGAVGALFGKLGIDELLASRSGEA